MQLSLLLLFITLTCCGLWPVIDDWSWCCCIFGVESWIYVLNFFPERFPTCFPFTRNFVGRMWDSGTIWEPFPNYLSIIKLSFSLAKTYDGWVWLVIVDLLLLDWMTVSSRGPCGTEIGLKLGHSQDKGYVFSNQSHSKIVFFPNFWSFQIQNWLKSHGYMAFWSLSPFIFFLHFFKKVVQ